MDRNEFIGKLQMCYFGDKNAFNEIVNIYDKLNNIINILKKELTREILDNMPFDISERIQDLFKENK